MSLLLVLGALLLWLYRSNLSGNTHFERTSEGADAKPACRACCLRVMPWGGSSAVQCVEQCSRAAVAIGKSVGAISADCQLLLSAEVPTCDDYAEHVGGIIIREQMTPRSDQRFVYEGAALSCRQATGDARICAMFAASTAQLALCNNQ